MRDLFHEIDPEQCIRPQTITQGGGAITGSSVDLQGYESATVIVDFGAIDEIGASPVGTANVAIELEHSANNSSWSNVTDADVLGYTGVTSGVVTSPQTDLATVKIGYVGGLRYLRVILTPTGLTNGGPISAIVVKGHPRHAPAA